MDKREFVLPLIPKWRSPNQKIPNIPIMLKEIVDFRKEWTEIRKYFREEYFERQLKDIELKFFCHIQIEEGIGVQTEEETEEIIKQQESKCRKALGELQLNNVEEREPREKYRKMDSSEDKENVNSEMKSKSQDMIEQMYDEYTSANPKVPSKSKQETLNLYKTYKYLKELINEVEDKDQFKHSNLLDVECIQKAHKMLMIKVMNDKKTRPGVFSTKPRCAEFEKRCYYYPLFKRKDIVQNTLQLLVDLYNKEVDSIKHEDIDDWLTLERTFKYASRFLFSFLTLHPFADGNGRLGRLLCSYFLGVISPFPTAIYNVFSKTEKSDYVNALVDARADKFENVRVDTSEIGKSLAVDLMSQQPDDLCALMIEASWAAWKEFLKQVSALRSREPSKELTRITTTNKSTIV